MNSVFSKFLIIIILVVTSHSGFCSFDNSNYVLLSRQIAIFHESDVLSNNMANAETPGFKNGTVIYKQYIHHESNKDKVSFNYDVLSVKDFTPGKMIQTGNTLDIALLGNGFFRIGSSLGELYTRAGNFQLNGVGQLVTAQGYNVLSDGGEPIVIEGDVEKITVRENGMLTNGAQIIAQLGMAFFDEEQFLEPIGNYLYKAITPPNLTGKYIIYQGMLELSNVNTIAQITRMNEMQHHMTAVNNIVNMMDQLERDSYETFAKY